MSDLVKIVVELPVNYARNPEGLARLITASAVSEAGVACKVFVVQEGKEVYVCEECPPIQEEDSDAKAARGTMTQESSSQNSASIASAPPVTTSSPQDGGEVWVVDPMRLGYRRITAQCSGDCQGCEAVHTIGLCRR